MTSMDEEQRNQLMRRIARQLGNAIPLVEEDHFMSCAMCGQFFDMRDFSEVFYHGDQPHRPRRADA